MLQCPQKTESKVVDLYIQTLASTCEYYTYITVTDTIIVLVSYAPFIVNLLRLINDALHTVDDDFMLARWPLDAKI